MKTNIKKIIFSLILMASLLFVKAQETKSALDTLPGNVEQLQSNVSLLNRLKISGYIQTQWQMADTIGSPAAFSGGDFKGTDNRFMIRRGRIKFAYTSELSQYVLQFDVTGKGMGIKDAYISLTEPWLKTLTLIGGAFNRPFGYEIEYSSSSRETPERSRIFQTLFNQERDLGAKLTVQAPKTSSWNFIKLDAGLFTGNGLNLETDKYKDFIGHLYANKTFMNENLNIGLGVSYYNGGWASGTKYVYKMGAVTTATGTINGFTVDSTGYKVGAKMKREYYGIEAQISLNSVIGITTLRGEYLRGTQPGTEKTSGSPAGIWTKDPVTVYTTKYDTITHVAATSAKTTTSGYDPYIRNFSGGYFYFVQSIGQTKHEIVVKYDWYDPNTKISGNEIGITDSKTLISDIKYSTIGLGWIYHWNSNVRITAYYEIVTNETSNQASMANASAIKTFAKDQKDNVFTLRVQYKF
jgi:hypothetical protein